MIKKLYVGNLLYSVTDEALRELFSPFGPIESIFLSEKGFGFIEFKSPDDAKKALELDGKELEGRPLKVNEARPKQS